MSSSTRVPAPSYGVVVPVKPLSRAKSRLSSLGDDLRRDLVVAFAVDTVSAAMECALVTTVLVVTDEVDLARGLADLGVASVPDGHTGDLNATLVQGAAELVRRAPGLRPVALCGDLPSLRPEELAAVLQDSADHRTAFLRDAAGTGTTLFAGADLDAFVPRFGRASGEAHLAAGAVELRTPDASSVRRDVDTPDDLLEALAVGAGPRTRWVAARAGLLGPSACLRRTRVEGARPRPDALDAVVQDFLAVDFFAVDFLAGAFFAGAVFLAAVFLAGAFFAVVVFFAGAFFAVLREDDDVLAADVFLAGAFFAGAFLAGAFFAVDLLADAFEAVDLEALDAFFAGADFLAGADFDAAFFAGAVARLATSAAFFAGAERFTAFAASAAGFGSLGSFFAPETTALRSAPAVNLGIAVFFAFTRSPVRGLRTQRASRTRFSNEPKPVMATFSPRATSRVITSSTDSSACCACFLLPS